MASQEDNEYLKAEDDPFQTSQISLPDYDSETLRFNASIFATRMNDDNASLASLTQDWRTDDGGNPVTSSLDPNGKYPSVEEFCHSQATFSVVMANTDGPGFAYSQKLKKLFVKIESTCSFEAICEVPVGKSYFLRAMLVSVTPESQHEPLLRCRNHQAKDEGTENETIKEHVIRCKNEYYDYVGRGAGAFFEQRLAVRVPLGTDGVETRLTFQFVCQNTCFSLSQRKTVIVFTLEDAAGHVWGRRVLLIKICTNFRRDMLNEEKALISKNTPIVSRPSGKRSFSVGRPRKRRYGDDTAGPSNRSAAPSRSRQTLNLDPQQVTLEMPSLRMTKRVLDYAIGIISASVLRIDEDEVKSELMRYVNNLRRQRQSLSISNSQCSVDSVLL